MSSVCYNALIITGPTSELDRFLQAAHRYGPQTIPFSLQRLYPMPAYLDSIEPGRRAPERQTWCTEHWGTRGEVRRVSLFRDIRPEQVTLCFATTNSPCDHAFTRQIAPLFPRLTFLLLYENLEAGLEGKYVWKRGRLVRRTDWGRRTPVRKMWNALSGAICGLFPLRHPSCRQSPL